MKAKEFSLFVFVKNCYLPGGPFVLDKCKIIPHDNLGTLDVIESVKRFIQKDTSVTTEFMDIDSLQERIGAHKPTAILYFPSIKATDIDAVFNILMEKLENLINLLSYRRMSKVDVYASLIYDKTDKKIGLSVPKEPYPGNWLPDFASESTYLMNTEKKVAGDKFLQLILNLYRHTIAEKRSDFIYFAFWNILETMARFKEYDIKKNPDGTIKFNKKGKPIKCHAESMVQELIRDIYKRGNMNLEFNANGKIYSVAKMTTMWYQHRNCTAHKGGCNFNDSSQCDTTKTEIVECRNCTVDASPLEADLYLRTLKRVTWEVMTNLLYN